MDLVDNIFASLKPLNSENSFLCVQIKRSSISIPSNIAEGCSRSSSKEFSRFIQIALGSSFELETQLIIADRKNLIELNFVAVFDKLAHLQKKLNALNTTLLKK